MTASECLHVLTAAIASRSEVRITTAHVVVFGTPLALDERTLSFRERGGWTVRHRLDTITHVSPLPPPTHRVASRRHDRGVR